MAGATSPLNGPSIGWSSLVPIAIDSRPTPFWDPADPEFRADPYPYYRVLRDHAPAFHGPEGNVVLTRYDDVRNTLRSPTVSRDIFDQVEWDLTDEVQRRRQQRSTAKSILTLDPPDHTRLRRLVSKAFTPRSIEALAPRIEAMTAAALDSIEDAERFELIDTVAYPIPFNVISELLGVPTDGSDEIREWSQALTAALEPNATMEDLDAAEAALWKIIPYLVTIINERRSAPSDDLISALLAVEDNGDTLSGEELISFIVLLYVAGHETTVNLIGNGMLALLKHPDQLDRWRQDPSLDAHAVDELLRYDGPVQHTIRIPIEPMTYLAADGSPVVAPPHQPVFCVLGSGNRDEAHFDQPDELRLDRPNAASHLSFSAGIHYCLGASLARLEATTVLTQIIRRFPSIELAEPPSWRDRITIRGVDRLLLHVER